MGGATIRLRPVDPGVSDGKADVKLVPPPGERIGQVLVALGRLNDPQVSTVLARQAGDQRRFGEVAVALGFVTQTDIDLALSRQRRASAEEIVNLLPGAMTPAPAIASNIETLLAVRAQLVHRWFGNEPEQRTLAIVSPDSGDGRSWVTAHLARLFAELDDETLVIDANLRSPSLHQFFGVNNRDGLSTFLSGSVSQPPIRAVPGIAHLNFLPAGPAVPEPHKLIARRAFGLMLERLTERYSAIFVDTPAASSGGDALTTALRCSGALLVVRREHTRIADVVALKERLTQMTVEVVGAVINEGG
jgi:chain length determinant protein tyrosine kinase EpsG